MLAWMMLLQGLILAAPGLGVLSDYWGPCSGKYSDDQFFGVFPTNVKITLKRKYSKMTFFPSFFNSSKTYHIVKYFMKAVLYS